MSNETAREEKIARFQSLVNAIYDRYSDLSHDCCVIDSNSNTNSSNNNEDFSISSTSSSSESNSSSSSPTSETSGSNNGNTNNNGSMNVDISFYMPVCFSPRKTQSGIVLSSMSLIMSDQRISHVGDLDELENSCKNILELDLSKNEISDWIEVKKILVSLKKLRLLNLSLNPLSKSFFKHKLNNYQKNNESNNENTNDHEKIDEDGNNIHNHSNDYSYEEEYENVKNLFEAEWTCNHHNNFHHGLHSIHSSPLFYNTEHISLLSTLILNSCYIDLRIIELILNKLTNLNELHLSSNNYSNVNFSQEFRKNSLKILYFNNNNLTDWNEVCKLGRCFPQLENLVISHNNLTNFSTPSSSYLCTQNCFQKLQILIINKLKINEWSVIDQLREFPHLKHVRIQNIPLLNSYNEEEKYYMLVAHLDESIDSLNGSKITNDDKENCERKYIRHYMDLAQKPKRYYELESKHGKLNKLADVNLDCCKRVQCKIKFGEKCLFEKIDVRQTVGEFKKNLEKFVGQPSSRFKVFYIDIEACSMSIYGPEELKHPNRSLFSFNIRDGDEFEIDLKPCHTSPSNQQIYQQQPVNTNNTLNDLNQFCHLHHLHFHHYTSHFNNNSLHQLPYFNFSTSQQSSTKPLLIKNRKENNSNNNNTNNNNNNNNNSTSESVGSSLSSRTFKRTKPGMLTPNNSNNLTTKSTISSMAKHRFNNLNRQNINSNNSNSPSSLPNGLNNKSTNIKTVQNKLVQNNKVSSSNSNSNSIKSTSKSSISDPTKNNNMVIFTAGDPNEDEN